MLLDIFNEHLNMLKFLLPFKKFQVNQCQGNLDVSNKGKITGVDNVEGHFHHHGTGKDFLIEHQKILCIKDWQILPHYLLH